MSTSPAAARMEAAHAQHSRALFTFLLGRSRNDRHLAEDLLQETMLRAWRHLDSLPLDETSARRWLFAIARNVTIDTARMRNVRPPEVSLTAAGDLQVRDDPTEFALSMHALTDAFGRLSAIHQVILRDLYVEGHSAQETARRLSLPVGTVKSRAHYGLRALRRALQ